MKTDVLSLVGICIITASSSLGQSQPDDGNAIAATVDGFSSALQKGEGAAAMELLAPDAVILESGVKQTREEYAKKHLQEDMDFLRTVVMTRSDLVAKREGDTAWVTSLSHSVGKFEGKEINSQGAELMILTKTNAGWRIRAIHWSSHSLQSKHD